VSWTDEHSVTHEVIEGSVLYTRCMYPTGKPGVAGSIKFDPAPRPITCFFCLVFDIDAAMLYALQEMQIRGFTVDHQVLAELERKVQNMHRP